VEPANFSGAANFRQTLQTEKLYDDQSNILQISLYDANNVTSFQQSSSDMEWNLNHYLKRSNLK